MSLKIKDIFENEMTLLLLVTVISSAILYFLLSGLNINIPQDYKKLFIAGNFFLIMLSYLVTRDISTVVRSCRNSIIFIFALAVILSTDGGQALQWYLVRHIQP